MPKNVRLALKIVNLESRLLIITSIVYPPITVQARDNSINWVMQGCGCIVSAPDRQNRGVAGWYGCSGKERRSQGSSILCVAGAFDPESAFPLQRKTKGGIGRDAASEVKRFDSPSLFQQQVRGCGGLDLCGSVGGDFAGFGRGDFGVFGDRCGRAVGGF